MAEKKTAGPLFLCAWLVKLSSLFIYFPVEASLADISCFCEPVFTAEEDLEVHLGKLRRFPVRELLVATENFSKKKCIG